MTVEWALILALATGLLCGWLARWQWERRDPDDDDWGDVFSAKDEHRDRPPWFEDWNSPEDSIYDIYDRWDRS